MSAAEDVKPVEEEYVLYYWPVAGRGEFIRLLFAESAVPFREVTVTRDVMMEITDGTLGFPGTLPPTLKNGDTVLSETPVICRYLASRFGLDPDLTADKWKAEQVNSTIHSFINEGRLVFHGKNFIASYYTQQEETEPYIEWFTRERLHVWLGHFEKILSLNNGGKTYVVGDKLTYVDLALFHVLRAAKSQFTEAYDNITTIPLLKAFVERIASRKNIQSYLRSDKCKPFEGNSMM